MAQIKRAILSTYHKEGIVDFAKGLEDLGIEMLSTGGTYRLLSENGVKVQEVSDYTGFPEMLGGRVKTLHPKIHGGILGKRDDAEHQAQMAEHNIGPIDLVVVNLYPFQETIAKPDVSLAEAIEQIDIGGPTMLRSAAKNYKDVAVVVDPTDYEAILDEIKKQDGTISEDRRLKLAKKVFFTTSGYDQAIFAYLNGLGDTPEKLPDLLSLQFEKVQTLRYGENPHQEAAFYRAPSQNGGSLNQLWGKEMSYNNFLDMDAAFELACGFKETAAVIVKHNNPCGVATDENLAEAYRKARACDPTSAFGGVAAFNRTVDVATAEEITSTFMEVVIAPKFDDAAMAIFKKKKNLRIIESPHTKMGEAEPDRLDLRPIAGGLLVQDHDTKIISDAAELKIVSRRPPSKAEMAAMLFAWRVCKSVKSNAIIYAKPGQAVGIGAGQMSRVDSVKLATMKAQMPIKGCVMASDAFFPFRDGIDAAKAAGITAVIQPGGSIRDNEIIDAVNEMDMAMVLTEMRHFKH
ncbi:MAG: bifunctional phosphoribosylaminoimidazolecarboxamide formyltransferase/IMP cyclohydrolase [Nitrospirae bacterium]|nr:bifunctional phosphoribosylaminoimidazolecarboxamide formyltransferase/IMP cyclohydrolase [Candidatus Manganitrophaceae bacterium]